MVGDYYLLIAILKNSIMGAGNNTLTAATAFFTVYHSLLLHTTNIALVDTLGIMASQDIGAKKMKYASLRLKQSITIGFLAFFVLTVFPSFFYKNFLINFLGVDSDVAELSQTIVIWSLPAMGVRILNDCLKTFLQSRKKEIFLGKLYTGMVVFFLILTLILINGLGYQVIAFELILFLFELVGVGACLFSFWYLEEYKELNFSLKFSFELKTFLKLFLDNYLTDSPMNLLFEFENFLVNLSHSNEEMAIFTIFSTLLFVFYNFASGLTIDVRTSINHEIGRNDFESVRKYLQGFKKFYWIAAFFCSLMFLLMMFGFELTGVYGEPGSETRSLASIMKYLFFVRSYFSFVYCFIKIALKSGGMVRYLHYFDVLPNFNRPLCGYIMSYYFDFGVMGLYTFGTFSIVAATWLLYAFIEDDIFIEHAKEFKIEYADSNSESVKEVRKKE